MKNLHHPNIITFKEVFEDADKFYLIMEYCPGKELFDVILQKSSFSETEARPVFLQVSLALCYLHSLNIIHRDIKPENVLLVDPSVVAPGDDGFSSVKLLDFGLSKNAGVGGSAAKTFVGTPCYVAPEVEWTSKGKGGTYGLPADCWSLGALLYVMLVARFPEFELDISANVYRLRLPDALWSEKSSEAKDLVRGLMTVNPTHRMTIYQVLQHPWMREYCMTEQEISDMITIQRQTSMANAANGGSSHASNIAIDMDVSPIDDPMRQHMPPLDETPLGSPTSPQANANDTDTNYDSSSSTTSTASGFNSSYTSDGASNSSRTHTHRKRDRNKGLWTDVHSPSVSPKTSSNNLKHLGRESEFNNATSSNNTTSSSNSSSTAQTVADVGATNANGSNAANGLSGLSSAFRPVGGGAAPAAGDIKEVDGTSAIVLRENSWAVAYPNNRPPHINTSNVHIQSRPFPYITTPSESTPSAVVKSKGTNVVAAQDMPLLDLQKSIADCFEEAHECYKDYPQLASDIRLGAVLCRQQVLDNTKMLSKVEQTADVILDMFPDVELAVADGEPELAAVFFNLVKSWIVELRETVSSAQSSNHQAMSQIQLIVDKATAGIHIILSDKKDRQNRAIKNRLSPPSTQEHLNVDAQQLEKLTVEVCVYVLLTQRVTTYPCNGVCNVHRAIYV